MPSSRHGSSSQKTFLIALLIVQIACAALYLINLLSSITGIGILSWAVHEFIELGAALGLLLGVVLGAIPLRRTPQRNQVVEDQLKAASGAFMDLLNERFEEWALTPAECDVALFSIKGLSIQEIAGVRDVSEGTIKAQTNAIYRKQA